MRRQNTENQKQVIRLRRNGLKPRHIAKELGISKQRVYQLEEQYYANVGKGVIDLLSKTENMILSVAMDHPQAGIFAYMMKRKMIKSISLDNSGIKLKLNLSET